MDSLSHLYLRAAPSCVGWVILNLTSKTLAQKEVRLGLCKSLQNACK